MRRSAISIAANISKGFKKKSKKDKINFYNIAQGSLEELKYYIILCKDLNYIKSTNNFEILIEKVGRLLSGLIKSLR